MTTFARHAPQSRSSTVILGRNRSSYNDDLDVECWHVPQKEQSKSSAKARLRSEEYNGRPLADKKLSQEPEHDDAGLACYETEEDLTRMRVMWRNFRRRMKAQQAQAVKAELREQRERSLQLAVEEDAFATEPILFVDCCHDDSNEVENGKNANYSKKTKKNKKEEGGGSFWEFFQFNKRHKNPIKKLQLQNDADSVSTAENTSLADDASLQSYSSLESWHSVSTEQITNRRFHREILLNHYGAADDPWSAAHRGDLDALETRWQYRHNWTLEDDHGRTPLYYACQSGGATNLRVVLFMLKQWPKDRHIPQSLLDQCKLDAANDFVLELLKNPSQAEWIIQEFEESLSRDSGNSSNGDVVDYIENRYRNPRLFGIREEREDDY